MIFSRGGKVPLVKHLSFADRFGLDRPSAVEDAQNPKCKLIKNDLVAHKFSIGFKSGL
jgi:hypothetical protein